MKKITSLLFCLLAFSFANAQFGSIAIVGDAVGGWPNDPQTDANVMTSTDMVDWTYNGLVVGTGAFKFRADNAWDNSFGPAASGTSPLSGTGVLNGGDNFQLNPGTYDVTFNSTSLEYTFTAQATGFNGISLSGSAVGTTNIVLSTTDGINYSALAQQFVDGDLNFVVSGNTDTFYGALDFPSGIAVEGSADMITVPAGLYNVTFNAQTGAYSFDFVSIALVGASTPAGWPTGVAGEIDAQVMSTSDGENYLLNSIDLMTVADNGMKFRQNNSWAVNYGAADFPSGTGTLNGANIIPIPGTYSVHFNRVTGAYSFEAPLAVNQFNQNGVVVYPNPSRSNWNVSVTGQSIQNVRVVDFTGKTIMNVIGGSSDAAINASGLSTGIYFATITTATSVKTVKLVKS